MLTASMPLPAVEENTPTVPSAPSRYRDSREERLERVEAQLEQLTTELRILRGPLAVPGAPPFPGGAPLAVPTTKHKIAHTIILNAFLIIVVFVALATVAVGILRR